MTGSTAKSAGQPDEGVTLVRLGLVPQSFNRTRYGHWTKAWRATSELGEALDWALIAAGLPRPLARVHASGTCFFTTNRRRDTGNFRTPLEKALGDALVRCGFLPDDVAGAFEFGSLELAQGDQLETHLRLEWRKP